MEGNLQLHANLKAQLEHVQDMSTITANATRRHRETSLNPSGVPSLIANSVAKIRHESCEKAFTMALPGQEGDMAEGSHPGPDSEVRDEDDGMERVPVDSKWAFLMLAVRKSLRDLSASIQAYTSNEPAALPMSPPLSSSASSILSLVPPPRRGADIVPYSQKQDSVNRVSQVEGEGSLGFIFICLEYVQADGTSDDHAFLPSSQVLSTSGEQRDRPKHLIY
jgi:hypothetical protein